MTLTTDMQQFEEWLKFHSDEEECTNLLQRNSAGTNYLHPHADLAWIAWRASREALANREAQPVAWRYRTTDIKGNPNPHWSFSEEASLLGLYQPLYAAPPVPELITEDEQEEARSEGYADSFRGGWNACRAAMLAQSVSGGYTFNSLVIPDGWKLVPIDATRAMIDAAQRVEEDGYDAMHKAMLAAAPAAFSKTHSDQ